MKTKLIIEKDGNPFQTLGIFYWQPSLDQALLIAARGLKKGESLAVIDMEPVPFMEEDKSALEMAEEDFDKEN
jgi:hypothetical protein